MLFEIDGYIQIQDPDACGGVGSYSILPSGCYGTYNSDKISISKDDNTGKIQVLAVQNYIPGYAENICIKISRTHYGDIFQGVTFDNIMVM